jgi:hypothetical protein
LIERWKTGFTWLVLGKKGSDMPGEKIPGEVKHLPMLKPSKKFKVYNEFTLQSAHSLNIQDYVNGIT